MTQQSHLTRLADAVSLFHKTSAGMTSNTISVFLLIANHEGITPAEIKARTGIDRTHLGRTLRYLADRSRQHSHKEPLGLVRVVNRGPTLRPLYLTEKGRALAHRLGAILDQT